MAKEFLKPIYLDVYDTEFISSSFESRMEMQKLIYILQEAGIQVGDYNFTWYKHGPYSQLLQEEILSLNTTNNVKINYSSEAREIIGRVKEIFNKDVQYSRSAWVECIASIHYLKVNIFPFNTSREDILRELVERKPHLNNKKDNDIAFDDLLFIMG